MNPQVSSRRPALAHFGLRAVLAEAFRKRFERGYAQAAEKRDGHHETREKLRKCKQRGL
jgi:hypothetical protein